MRILWVDIGGKGKEKKDDITSEWVVELLSNCSTQKLQLSPNSYEQVALLLLHLKFNHQEKIQMFRESNAWRRIGFGFFFTWRLGVKKIWTSKIPMQWTNSSSMDARFNSPCNITLSQILLCLNNSWSTSNTHLINTIWDTKMQFIRKKKTMKEKSHVFCLNMQKGKKMEMR